ALCPRWRRGWWGWRSGRTSPRNLDEGAGGEAGARQLFLLPDGSAKGTGPRGRWRPGQGRWASRARPWQAVALAETGRGCEKWREDHAGATGVPRIRDRS